MVQRNLADAEARAAAEEDAAAAAEAAANAAAAPWSHHANGQAFSVSSSADMSQGGFSAAGEQQQQHTYAAYTSEQQVCMQQSGLDSEDLVAQQVQALEGNMVTLTLNGATMQHEQPQIQQQLRPQPQQQQAPFSSSQTGVMHALPQPAPAAAQMQQSQMHSEEQQQAAQQQYQASYQQQAPVLISSAAKSAEGPRDVLGRPVVNTPGGLPAVPSVQPQLQPQQAAPFGMGAPAPSAGLLTNLVQQPQQQPPSVVAASPQTAAACAGAAAVAAAAAAAAGDASSQARHLTVLVHRLQSRPAVDVLAELAACASVLCKQAWQDNFSKVCAAQEGRQGGGW